MLRTPEMDKPLEAALLIGPRRDDVLYEHTPADRTSTHLPDSMVLWEKIWEHRGVLCGIAHSHPWNGFPSPSEEDCSTFAALELALGRRFDWWIVTLDRVSLFQWDDGMDEYVRIYDQTEAPKWVERLRAISR